MTWKCGQSLEAEVAWTGCTQNMQSAYRVWHLSHGYNVWENKVEAFAPPTQLAGCLAGQTSIHRYTEPHFYHWQELPQVSFLLQQKNCCDKHVFVTMSFVTTNKTFVMTKLCLSRQNIFVATKLSSRQTHVCRDKVLLQQKWYLWQLLPIIHFQAGKK